MLTHALHQELHACGIESESLWTGASVFGGLGWRHLAVLATCISKCKTEWHSRCTVEQSLYSRIMHNLTRVIKITAVEQTPRLCGTPQRTLPLVLPYCSPALLPSCPHDNQFRK